MQHNRRQFITLGAATAAGAAMSDCFAKSDPGQRRHIVLLGDSIFDNGRYVPGELPVIEQLQKVLGRDHAATLCAQDGDVVADVTGQLAKVPKDATHLVVSAGGNDALGHQGLLERGATTSAELLGELAGVRAAFLDRYTKMLAAVRARGLPTAVCTIYDSNFAAPKKALADVALTVFNDAILRAAGDAGVPVVDLRRVFRAPADYANPIEPSAIGGAKMVDVIARMIVGHDFTVGRCVLWA